MNNSGERKKTWNTKALFFTWGFAFLGMMGHLPAQDFYAEFAGYGTLVVLTLLIFYIAMIFVAPKNNWWIFFSIFNVAFWFIYDRAVDYYILNYVFYSS